MCRLQHFISDLWKQGGSCEPHHNLLSLIPRLLGALGASKFRQMSPCLRMSSFWAPSNRTRDSSHRWLLGHRSPSLSALRSVEVRKKRPGSASERGSTKGARRPNLYSRLLQQSPPGLDVLTTTRMNGTELA